MYPRKSRPLLISIVLLFGFFLAFSQQPFAQELKTLPDNIDISGSPTGIVPMPDTADPIFGLFDRYTKVVAPNGKPIHIVVEPGYADRQVIYARTVLINHLTDLPGSTYGRDKSTIANAMANSGAILFLFKDTSTFQNYFRGLPRNVNTNGQDLRAYETILEGTPGYMDQRDPTRDASYEEIMHFVQQYGIMPGHPTLHHDLFDAFYEAREKNIYRLDANETDEYFICGFEAYYDMWAHDPGGEGHRENEYLPISHMSLKVNDPKMYDIIEGFMGKHWRYMAEVVEEYRGAFSLARDEDLTYTYKSQHLRKAALTGDNNSDLIGNDSDNTLFGNSGNNEIAPGAGFDVIDGGPGIDTAIFPGNRSQYIIRPLDGRLIVDGEQYARDGQNILINVERLQFADTTVEANSL